MSREVESHGERAGMMGFGGGMSVVRQFDPRLLPESVPASIAVALAVRVCAVTVHNRRSFADGWEPVRPTRRER
jgi:hypothetical protein